MDRVVVASLFCGVDEYEYEFDFSDKIGNGGSTNNSRDGRLILVRLPEVCTWPCRGEFDRRKELIAPPAQTSGLVVEVGCRSWRVERTNSKRCLDFLVVDSIALEEDADGADIMVDAGYLAGDVMQDDRIDL